MFAADWLLDLTGIDHAADYRGKYSDEKGAARLIAKAGGMRSLASSLKEKPVGLAQRGNIVLALMDERETYGVVDFGVWCAPGPEGLVFRPIKEAIAAFEV